MQLPTSKGQLTTTHGKEELRGFMVTDQNSTPKPPLIKRRSICFSFLSASGVSERRHAPGPSRNPTAPLKFHKSIFFFQSTRWAIGCHLERCWSSLFPLKAIFCSISCTELMKRLSAWKYTACFMFRFA